MKRILLLFLVLLALMLNACKTQTTEDLSKVQVSLHIDRFEKDLFSLDYNHIPDSIPELRKKYGEFFNLFVHKVVLLGNPDNPMFPEMLKSFITDYNMNIVNKEVARIFHSFDSINEIITPAFKRFHLFFPEKNIPHIYTYISGFNQSIVTSDTLLGIGLDKYLGSNNDLYSRLGLSKYQKYNMYPGKIPADCI